jgi:DNA polymerase-3 subunit alpha
MQIRIRTEYSFQKSLIRQEEYINYCLENNKPLVICEYNSIRGLNKLMLDKSAASLQKLVALEVEHQHEHFIAIARNYDGYRYLAKLSSLINLNQPLPTKITSNNVIIVPIKSSISAPIMLNNLFDLTIVAATTKEELEYLNAFTRIDQFEYVEPVIALEQVNFDVIEESGIFEKVEQFELAKKYPNNSIMLYSNNDFDFLTKIIKSRLRVVYPQLNQVIVDRVKKELDTIQKMNFASYFLVVYEITQYAQTQKIKIGFGRGSSAGSILAYILGITNVDPIKYNLLFERFLNIERGNFPDIDLDIQDDKRDLIIEYLANKYQSKFAQILTYTTFGKKVVVKDFAKSLKLSENDIMLLNLYMTKPVANFGFESELINSTFLKILEKVAKMPRQTSIHAAGVIIANLDIASRFGLMEKNNAQLIEMDHIDCEKAGLVKFDLLGLSNLRMIDNLEKRSGVKMESVPLNDPEVMNQFMLAQTDSIFQFESPGVKETLQKVKPNNISELAIVTALYRPGPMENIDQYAKNKRIKFNGHKISELNEILSETSGIIIYQEQVIMIFRHLAKLSLSQADSVRVAISKKDSQKLVEPLNKLKAELANKYDEATIQNLIDDILKFGGYGFNKSHAISYSLLSYYQMYYKVKYPHLFEYLTLHNVTGTVAPETYTKFAHQKTKIILPKINLAFLGLEFQKSNLYVGISNVKGIGIKTAQKVVKVANSKEYKNLFDFLYLTKLDRDEFVSLAKINFFEPLGYNQQTLIDNHTTIFEMLRFYVPNVQEISVQRIIDSPAIDIPTQLKYELEVIGYSPLVKHLKELVVYQIRKVTTRNNKTIYYLTCLSRLGYIEVFMFDSVFNKYQPKVNQLLRWQNNFEVYRGKLRINYN